MNLEEHRPYLRRIAYRMTGTLGDADDVVQEAFVRTLTHPPKDLSRPLLPWLVRVTMNVARDQLRRRRRRGYVGPWLPGVVDQGLLDGDEAEAGAAPAADALYGLRESVTYAFLLALEALTPVQRAVLVLREVFDFSGKETAEALGISEDNAKTILSRAKKAIAAYEQQRCVPDEARLARDSAALQRFITALATDDVEGMVAALRADVVSLSDGGGVYQAARIPIVGRDRVIQVYRGLQKLWPPGSAEVEFAVVNAQPAIILRAQGDLLGKPGFAPLWVLRVDTDDDGLITALHSVSAPGKVDELL